MQNLSGPNSIIGRSIYLVAVSRSGEGGEVVSKTALSCCKIVIDRPPQGYASPPKPAPQPHYPYPSHYQGAGFW